MLEDLYQEVILDHSKRPRNFHQMADATRRVEGYNPLCGDKLALFVKMDGDTVQDISFVGAGCAISTASASLMTETVKGKSRAGSRADDGALPRPADHRKAGCRRISASWQCSPACANFRRASSAPRWPGTR